MNDVLNDALSNLEHDNYELSYQGYKDRQADIALIRDALAAQPAASAGPSDEQIDMVFSMYGWSTDDGRELRPEMWREAVRMLLSRYGRPAGDAQPVAIVKENPYCPEGLSDEINEYLPNGTMLYAAPVPAQKADDAKLPAKMPEYEAVGGEYPSNDSYQEGYAEGWNAAIDAAIAQQRKGE